MPKKKKKRDNHVDLVALTAVVASVVIAIAGFVASDRQANKSFAKTVERDDLADLRAVVDQAAQRARHLSLLFDQLADGSERLALQQMATVNRRVEELQSSCVRVEVRLGASDPLARRCQEMQGPVRKVLTGLRYNDFSRQSLDRWKGEFDADERAFSFAAVSRVGTGRR